MLKYPDPIASMGIVARCLPVRRRWGQVERAAMKLWGDLRLRLARFPSLDTNWNLTAREELGFHHVEE